MVIILCLSTVGSITYSWFSDTEQSEIDITTGNIDLTVVPSNVKVQSYNGLSKDVNDSATTDLGGTVSASKTNKGVALSVSFMNATPGDILSFDLERSIINTINVSYLESYQVSYNGAVTTAHPFIITGVNNMVMDILPNNTKHVISSSPISIEFDKNAGASEMGKTYSIVFLFQAYQANAPIYDMTTTTIKTGTNTIGVKPNSGLSSSTYISFEGTSEMNGAGITITALDTSDSTYVLSESSPLAGITVNSDVDFRGKDVKITFTLPGNVPKNNISISHNNDVVWTATNSMIGDLEVMYDGINTTVSFTTALGFSYYAVYVNGFEALSNGIYYEKLSDAIDKTADDSTISILNNHVSLDGKTLTHSISIDLAGNTLELTKQTINANGNSFIIKNGTVISSGTFGYFDLRGDWTDEDSVIFEDVNFIGEYYKNHGTRGSSTTYTDTILKYVPNQGSNINILFKDCSFKDCRIEFNGTSGNIGAFDTTFDNCTFDCLTNSNIIYCNNYISDSTITIKDCAFDITVTSNVTMIESRSSSVVIKAEGTNYVNGDIAIATGEELVGTPDEVKLYTTQSLKLCSEKISGEDTFILNGITKL